MPKTICLAFTGASGMPYGIRLLECLLEDSAEKPDWLPDLLTRQGGRELVLQYLDYKEDAS